MEYRAEIDGLRAIAVLPVILFHAGFDAFGGGFVGVDVFFVISGYLITTIISSELTHGTFSLSNFYERRARRILPALFFVMAVCVPFAWILLMPRDLDEFARSLVAVSTFWSNFFFWGQSGYFAIATELKPLLHTWSLAVEEQYYIVFPPFLLLMWRLGKDRILLMLCALGASSLAMAHVAAYTAPDAAFFLPHARAWEILLGAIAALKLNGNHANRLPVPVNQGLSLLGLILIGFSVISFDESTPFPSLYALVPTIGTVLVILFAQSGTAAHRVLRNRALVSIGLISYSAYLWHQPVFAFAKYYSRSELPPLTMVLLSLASLPLAGLTWLCVERPFRKSGAIERRFVPVAAVTLITAFAALGLYGYESNAPDSRLAANPRIVGGDTGHKEYHRFLSETFYDCQPEEIARKALFWEGFRRCQQSKNSDRIDVAIIGDSHAEHLFIGVAESLPKKNVVYYINHGAPFVSSHVYQPAFEAVAKNSSIELVILTMFWSRSLADEINREPMRNDLQSTVDFLTRHGKKVILVGDVPAYRFDPEQCKYLLRFSANAQCDKKEDVVVGFEERSMLSKIAGSHRDVSFVSLRDVLCENRTCRMDMGGTILYRDSNHLNISGSRYVGTKLVERMASFDST